MRKWLLTYRAVGRGALWTWGAKGSTTARPRSPRPAPSSTGGWPSPRRWGASASRAAPLKCWCRLYREGGADALRPKPKGRPRGSGAKAAPATREEELEREVRRLEAQVAYLKKSIALKAELGLPLGTGRRP